MERQDKEKMVEGLRSRFAKAMTTVVAEYKGLTVAELNQLRKELREVGGEYYIAKNTLVEIALEGSPHLSLKDLLSGQNGLVLGYGDPVTLAKAVVRYAKEHEKFVVKGGVSDGQFLSSASVEEISQLPSHEVLRAQLLGILNRPASLLVGLLAEPGSSFARLLNSRHSQIENS